MLYREINPNPSLSSYVKCFWVWQSDSITGPHLHERILPDGCIELIFNSLDHINWLDNASSSRRHNRSYVAGQIKTAIQLQPTGKVNLFGIKFHPFSAYPILGYKLSEFTDKEIALDLVWGSLAREIEDRIMSAQSIHGKIKIIEEFLLKRIRSNEHYRDRFVDISVNIILQKRGLVSVEQLSSETGISRRQLEKKFQINVGISPKLLSRITRFQNVLKIIDKNKNYDWPSAIFECDFYDQSHFIKDFKALSGQNPLNYFKKKHLIR